MKNCSKMFMYPLFIIFSLFCWLNLSNGDSCNSSNCPGSISRGDFTIFRYPFRLVDLQPNSCGIPGFDLYCNDSLGTLLKLPTNVVLKVNAIVYYYDKQIFLSDPSSEDCLPQKLMSFDLTGTPFYPDGITKKFWLYNCSGYVDLHVYDQIDCLSGAGYTVISSGSDVINDLKSSNCSFVKTLTLPVPYDSIKLGNVSAIYLTWNGTLIPPARSNPVRSSISQTVKSVVGILGLVCLILFCCYRVRMHRMEQRTLTLTTHRGIIDNTTDDVGGLDQVTIDSYPVVVIGKSGRLIKPDDNNCPICLSDYCPHETLKMLPQCLHRFHAECIDQWLRSKGICPLCRTSPPQI